MLRRLTWLLATSFMLLAILLSFGQVSAKNNPSLMSCSFTKQVTTPAPDWYSISNGLVAGRDGFVAQSVAGVFTPSLTPLDTGFLFSIRTVPSQTSPTEAYAIGSELQTGGMYLAVVEHGSLIGPTWTFTKTTIPSANFSELYGLTVVSSTQAVAVGTTYVGGGVFGPTVEKFNGISWTNVGSVQYPNTGDNHYLNAVTYNPSNSSELWAVGYTNAQNVLYVVQSVDGGNHWLQAPMPTVTGTVELRGITYDSTGNLYVVGYKYSGSSYSPVAFKKDGTGWHDLSPSVPNGQLFAYFNSVTMIGPQDFLVVGGVGNTPPAMGIRDNGPSPNSGLIEEWNGSSWSVLQVPAGTPELQEADGNQYVAGAAGAILTTSCSEVTPTATATVTVTPTATTCSVSYSDVHPSDYFYTPVQYLACHGVVSGYNDGTFRPYNNTTRGQLSKILSLGFAMPITTPGAGNYTFADVQPSNTFFSYVETVAAGGIVSGYTCGGSGEPCDGSNRPYFRVGNNVSRGQLTKMVDLSAQWTLINPSTATFSDVPVGSTFYQYVETAVCHGIINGYSDGTFKPNSSALRGQISKIVYLALQVGSCSSIK